MPFKRHTFVTGLQLQYIARGGNCQDSILSFPQNFELTSNHHGYKKITGKKIRGVPNWTHLGEIHLYKAGRSLYRERPAVFMRQQARLVEFPVLSAIPHIHAGPPCC